MRILKGAAAAVLIAALAACQPGGGGGEVETETATETRTPSQTQQAAAPPPAGVDAGKARDYLGNAFVSAARVHASVVEGEFNAAQNSLNDVRRQMDLAEQHATLNQQREINRLESQVIDLQGELQSQSPGAMQASNQMVQGFFDYYQQLASAGGGAGQGLTTPQRQPMTPQRQQPGDYPPPAQVEPQNDPLLDRSPTERRDPVGAEDPLNPQLEQPYSP